MLNFFNTFDLIAAPLFALRGIYILTTPAWQWKTLIFCAVTSFLGLIGVNAGAHRYWSHRAFKATWPLKYILLFMFTLSGQDSIWYWVANHRIHHKHCDTDKDPHSINKGFWHAHIGWIFTQDRRQLKEDIKAFDMSDIENDPVIMFQEKYETLLRYTCSVIIPFLIPWYFWGETLEASVCVGTMLRIVYVSHATFSINSFAHMFGFKPYDKNMAPAENKWVSIFGMGEGWHNFHHAFPWDYCHNEYGANKFNPASNFIELCAWLGLAYDLKRVSPKIVEKRAMRTGDGSYECKVDNNSDDDKAWGWGDPDIPEEKLEATEILYRSKRNDF